MAFFKNKLVEVLDGGEKVVQENAVKIEEWIRKSKIGKLGSGNSPYDSPYDLRQGVPNIGG